MNRDSSRKTFAKVMQYIGRYRFLLFASLVLAGLSVIGQLYVPVLFGKAIDEIVGKGNVNFGRIAIMMKQTVLVIAASAALTGIMNIINNRVVYQTVKEIRARAMRQIQKLPLSVLDSHSSGDIMQRVTGDADALSDGLLNGMTQLFSGIIMIIATLYFMFSRSVEVSLLVVILTPLSFLVAKFIASGAYGMFRKANKTRGDQTAYLNEMVGSMRVVQAFGYQERASKRFRKVNEELQDYAQKAIFFSSLTNPCTRAVNSLIYAIVALAGSFLILKGRLTVGGLSVLLAYANQYMKPFNDISSVITEMQNALSCADRIFALIETEPEPAEKDAVLSDVKGHVQLNHVCFQYDPSKPLIRDFTMEAKPGMHIALVGPTGCGKTTLINLLMRFYDVNRGEILVDGKNIQDVTRHSLRQQWGMVLQDTWLKNGTVRENLALADPDASEEQMIAACKEAHSWGFISQLSDGLDTQITEDTLSAGQKQMLCITRVMLGLPQMLILDEATSSIDTRTEIQIQDAFDRLMAGRTTFVVAHRLSTIRHADLILVMKDGMIMERGTHEQLLAENGFYKQLYEAQFASVQEMA